MLAPKAEERKARAIKERDDMGRAVSTPANLAEVAPSSNRETRKVAAVGTGYSGSTLDKVDRIRDAAERGLLQPIVLDGDGRIVDGRNRWRACLLAGIEPTSRVYQGTEEELLPFLVSLNMARRHMDESQRAMVAAKIANLPKHANQHVAGSDEVASIEATSQGTAADLMNVSRSAVQRARKVADHAAPENAVPELVEAVESGRVSVSAASERVTG